MANVTSLMRQGRQLGTIRPARSNVLINTQSGPLSFSMINTQGLITKTVKSAEGIKAARQRGAILLPGLSFIGASASRRGRFAWTNARKKCANVKTGQIRPKKRWFILITDEAGEQRDASKLKSADIHSAIVAR